MMTSAEHSPVPWVMISLVEPVISPNLGVWLYKAKQITYKDALKHADSPNDLRLQIKLSEEGAERLMQASSNITFDGQA